MSGLWCCSQGLFQGRVKTHPRRYFGHSHNECGKGRGEQLVLTDKMAMFRPYPLRVGQKIHIEGGPRGATGRSFKSASARSPCDTLSPSAGSSGTGSAISLKSAKASNGPEKNSGGQEPGISRQQVQRQGRVPL